MSVKDTHLYDILHIPPSATSTEIRKAYRKEALKNHPDKNPNDPHATEKFQEINRAYDILRDEQKRKNYDMYGLDGIQETSTTNEQEETCNEFYFNLPERPPDPSGLPRTPDGTYVKELTIKQAYLGHQFTLKYTHTILCKKCHGTGICECDSAANKCKSCNGTGKRSQFVPSSRIYIHFEDPCPQCGGSGKDHSTTPCPVCAGEKKDNITEFIRIKTPPGIKSGEKTVLRGQSNEEIGHVPGDFIVEIKIIDDPNWEIQGDDLHLYCILSDNHFQKGSFTLHHLDGTSQVFQLPPGMTHGDSLKCPGFGYPINHNLQTKGFLYIHTYLKPSPQEINAPPPQEINAPPPQEINEPPPQQNRRNQDSVEVKCSVI